VPGTSGDPINCLLGRYLKWVIFPNPLVKFVLGLVVRKLPFSFSISKHFLSFLIEVEFVVVLKLGRIRGVCYCVPRLIVVN